MDERAGLDQLQSGSEPEGGLGALPDRGAATRAPAPPGEPRPHAFAAAQREEPHSLSDLLREQRVDSPGVAYALPGVDIQHVLHGSRRVGVMVRRVLD